MLTHLKTKAIPYLTALQSTQMQSVNAINRCSIMLSQHISSKMSIQPKCTYLNNKK